MSDATAGMAGAQEPRVELLWWSGCPSHDRAKGMVRAALDEAGLHTALVESRQIVTHAEAVAESFIGSPTIRINGRDIVAVAPSTPAALTCRLYFRRDGRPSALPDPEDLRDAISAATARAHGGELGPPREHRAP